MKKPSKKVGVAQPEKLDADALRQEGRTRLIDEIMATARARNCAVNDIAKAEAFMRGLLFDQADAVDDLKDVLRLLREFREHLSALRKPPLGDGSWLVNNWTCLMAPIWGSKLWPTIPGVSPYALEAEEAK